MKERTVAAKQTNKTIKRMWLLFLFVIAFLRNTLGESG
jgi:hypothetical protein